MPADLGSHVGMDIEISPAGVIRSADAVAVTAGQFSGGGAPSAAGNDGFMLSAAMSRYASQMEQTTAQAAKDTGTTAENLEVSATLLRRADDDVEGAAMSLWSKIS